MLSVHPMSSTSYRICLSRNILNPLRIAMTHSAHITEFEASNVEPANKLLPELPYFEAIELLLSPPSEVRDRQKP